MRKVLRHFSDMAGQSIKIKRGTTKDAQDIRALIREAFAKWIPVTGREPWPMSVDYKEALQKHRFDLLTINGTLAAVLETVSHDDYLLIENLAVSPVYQGNGLGSQLLDHAEQLARSKGHVELKLYFNKLWSENRTYYERHGYRVEREEEFDDGVCVYMNKAI